MIPLLQSATLRSFEQTSFGPKEYYKHSSLDKIMVFLMREVCCNEYYLSTSSLELAISSIRRKPHCPAEKLTSPCGSRLITFAPSALIDEVLAPQVAKLWIALAEYYIRQGMLEKARDIFQEGMEAVATVHDFTLIYNTLTEFEEKLIQIKMEKSELDEEVEVNENTDAEEFLLIENISDWKLRYISAPSFTSHAQSVEINRLEGCWYVE